MIARMLHLIDPGPAAWPATSLLAELAAYSPARFDHDVVLLGGRSTHRLALAEGLPNAKRIAPLIKQPVLAVRALRNHLRAKPVDVLVAWSVPAATLAHAAAGGLPVVAVLTGPPPPFEGSARWTFAARAIRRSGLIVYPSAFLRDSWVARFTLLGCPGSVIAVAPDAPSDHQRRRAELREEWSIPASCTVIMPIGEPAEAIDAHAAVFAAGVLGVAGHQAVVVVPSVATHIDRALRFAARIRPRRKVIVDDRPPRDLFPGADLALWFEPEGESSRPGRSEYTTPLGAVSAAWASASGLPIVAHEHPSWRSVLRGAPRCFPVAGRTRHSLTHALLRAINDTPPAPQPTAPGPAASWSARFETRISEMLKDRARTLARAM